MFSMRSNLKKSISDSGRQSSHSGAIKKEAML